MACCIEKHLRQLTRMATESSGCSQAASSALNIIDDVKKEGASSVDLRCLLWLLEAIHEFQPLPIEECASHASENPLCAVGGALQVQIHAGCRSRICPRLMFG